ncbi:Aldehyde dehydrogenase family 3 member B1, partial [Camelus dromedarius]
RGGGGGHGAGGIPAHPSPALQDGTPFTDTTAPAAGSLWLGEDAAGRFRAAQLKGLGRFLRENKQLLQEGLAQDLHKVSLELRELRGLKPSEVSKRTEKVLAEVLPPIPDQSCFAVVMGGPEMGQLLEHKFDYISSQHLTPITLELGGKNPAMWTTTATPRQ